MGPRSPAPESGSALCVIVPVWGSRHVRQFLDLALPSWLAAGNLPALSHRGLFVLVMTRAADIPLFERSGAFRRLRGAADAQMVVIDDLLGPGGVPVALTLAYQRGLAAVFARFGPLTAVLLNSDFVLADGSLRRLGEVLDGGARVVLAPSLRVIEERVEDGLLRQIAEDVLTLPPRALARAALDALHPTVLCSRVDQDQLWSANPNQLFWRPSSDLMLGRPFCLFTLALRVEGPVGPAAAYCDYGLAALAAPDAEPAVMDDSDRFLAVELGPLAQERAFAQVGAATPAVIAAKLSVWTTEFHRRQADHTIVYKAAEPAVDIAALIPALDLYVDRVRAALGPAQPLLDHPHWLGGVGAWRGAREDRGVFADPPELAPTADVRARPPRPGTGRGLRHLARALLVGWPDPRTAAHPYWLLEYRVCRAVSALGGAGARSVGVRVLERVSHGYWQVDPVRAGSGKGPYVVGFDLASPDRVEEILAELRRAPPAGPVLVIAMRGLDESIGSLAAADLLSRLDGVLALERLDGLDLSFDRRVSVIHGALADLEGGAGLAVRCLRSGLAMAAMFVVNLRRAAFGGRCTVEQATALVILGRGRGAPGA